MNMTNTRITGGYGLFVVAAMLTVASGLNVARAADTEAFEPQYVESRRPNVLFLVDSTSSLAPTTTSRPPNYESSTDYSTYLDARDRCVRTTAYFDASAAGAPDCTKKGTGKLPVDSKFFCDVNDNRNTLINVGTLAVKIVEKVTTTSKKGVTTTTWVPLSPSYPNTGSEGAYCEGETGIPAAANPAICSPGPIPTSPG
jgi:hypothetical protein